MKRVGHSVFAVGLCLLSAAGVCGQNQRPTLVRSVSPLSTTAWPVEPDAPGSSSAVVAGAHVVVPRLMKFSGSLHDAAGKPLSGTVDVTFALYNAEAGG